MVFLRLNGRSMTHLSDNGAEDCHRITAILRSHPRVRDLLIDTYVMGIMGRLWTSQNTYIYNHIMYIYMYIFTYHVIHIYIYTYTYIYIYFKCVYVLWEYMSMWHVCKDLWTHWWPSSSMAIELDLSRDVEIWRFAGCPWIIIPLIQLDNFI